MRRRVLRVLMFGVVAAGACVLPAIGQAAYTLPPDKLKIAQHLFRVRTLMYFGASLWGIAQLWLLLALGVAARMRSLAVRTTGRRWGQGFLFTFLLLGTVALLDLPLRAYGHHLGLVYGLSVQGWWSWLGDVLKGFLLDWVPTALGALLLFWLIRRSPERWWLWFWVPAMVAVVCGVFVAPILIDPLFNHFEPLAAHDPALVRRLKQVVARGSLAIPPERMFWMQASAKSTGINAYVTGIGPTKRVVVWDTSIAKATPDEIAFIFGHEMGHYVMNHIYRTLLFAAALMLVAFWAGFHVARRLLRRFGAGWGVESQQDWAALVVYLMVLAGLTFLSEPVIDGYSRAQEHAADVYGQEAMHGILPNPQETGRLVFQLLGENGLDDPAPHPWVEFWSYDHPSIANRAAFAAGYDPWGAGGHPLYFAQ